MQRFDDYDMDNGAEGYAADRGRQYPTKIKPNLKHQTPKYARRGATPTAYNGIHRRRQRRIMW
jgi:hypothetical protein